LLSFEVVKTVLIVEDNEDIREFEAMVVEHAGYAVLQAEDGHRALEILRTTQPSPCLVLLDMMMPRMDGALFLAELQKIERFSEIPIVVVSAAPLLDSIPRARRVISKPITMDMLSKVVAELAGPP
jgi:CheY-like chemotaxis protein